MSEFEDGLRYGFDLARQYVELALQYNQDPHQILKQKLEDWKKKDESKKTEKVV